MDQLLSLISKVFLRKQIAFVILGIDLGIYTLHNGVVTCKHGTLLYLNREIKQRFEISRYISI